MFEHSTAYFDKYLYNSYPLRAQVCLTAMLGASLGRPSVLGASQRFPLFLGQQARRGHSLLGQGDHHHHHEPQV